MALKPFIEYHKSLSSTNDHLKKNIEKYKNFDLIWTLDQKKGRGRGYKKWHGIKNKSLAFSLVVEKKSQLKSIPISLLAAISLCEVFIQLKNIDRKKIFIKWPNDILIGGKKVSGILVDEILHHWIIGIGINISHNSQELEKLNQNIQDELKTLKTSKKDNQQFSKRLATSIFEETKNEIKNASDIEKLLNKLHKQLMKSYQLYQSGGLQPFIKKWKQFSLCSVEEEKVEFLEDGKIKKAVLHNLAQNGVVVLIDHCKKMEIPWKNLILSDL